LRARGSNPLGSNRFVPFPPYSEPRSILPPARPRALREAARCPDQVGSIALAAACGSGSIRARSVALLGDPSQFARCMSPGTKCKGSVCALLEAALLAAARRADALALAHVERFTDRVRVPLPAPGRARSARRRADSRHYEAARCAEDSGDHASCSTSSLRRFLMFQLGPGSPGCGPRSARRAARSPMCRSPRSLS